MNSYPYRYFLVTILFSVILTSCATSPSPPSSFYNLTALEKERGTPLDPALLVGVGPVILPGYVDRTQMVSRVDSNQLAVDEFNRWAGDLEQNITSVLAENLSYRLSTDSVIGYPWGPAATVDKQVVVDIRRFDAGDDNAVHLVVQWRIIVEDGRKITRIERLELSEPVPGNGYNAIAAAYSRVLVELARRIAATLHEG